MSARLKSRDAVVAVIDTIEDDRMVATQPLRIAWIDSYRLTRECIMEALVSLHPPLAMTPYASAEECIEGMAPEQIDLIVYHSRSLGEALSACIAALHAAYETVPIVILSDASEDNQIRAIRDALRSGANGYICTRTSSILMAFASLRFVMAGGTFAPLELLLTEEPASPGAVEADSPGRLTSRQLTVLAEIKQGKANRIIARDLGMSESTVKVHIRNIMRKMGASNRTQAAFKALGGADGTEDELPSSA